MRKIPLLIIILSISGAFFTSCKKDSSVSTPIVVSAGLFQTIQLPVDSATLTGTVTSGQSSTLIYSWKQVAGPSAGVITNGSSTTTKVNNLVSGTYIFQFEATNSTGTVI